MAGVFERHDKSKFDTLAVSFTDGDGSEMRARLMRSFGRLVDVGNVSDAEVAGLLRQNEIDIAVDLMGFTGDSRPGILALRPAPVQVNHLGFPGTMGTRYIDYILADNSSFRTADVATATKPSSTSLIASCRPTSRALAPRKPSRAEAGLPADGFVFCSFNSIDKFSPDVRTWMRLLRAVPSACFGCHDSTTPPSQSQAGSGSGSVRRDRLVFAPFLAGAEQHLARLSLADLFLDTLPYNAHAGGSDALWAGVPIVTSQGTTFAGRVGASLLNAIGLPEMVADLRL